MLVVLCNAPPAESSELARTLVTEKLAACVNVISAVKSFYRWEGELCEETEDTLLIKVSKQSFERLRARILELHSYSVPEIVALEPHAVHDAYAHWVIEQSS